MESNETRVLSSIEMLGENATTKRVAAMAGLSTQTVERVALKYRYKRAFHGGPWLSTDDVVRSETDNEQIEVLNRMADAIESLAGKLSATSQVEQVKTPSPVEETSTKPAKKAEGEPAVWVRQKGQDGKWYMIVPCTIPTPEAVFVTCDGLDSGKPTHKLQTAIIALAGQVALNSQS